MKKQYEAPVAEKIEFCYRDQVVASVPSGECGWTWHDSEAGLGSSCQQDSYGSAL